MQHSIKTTWLFISRTQGTHKWHISALIQAIDSWIHHILYGIGSSNKERTSENPFNFQERENIAYTLMNLLQQDHPYISYEIYNIPDFNDVKARKKHIQDTVPDFDTLISWNPHVNSIWNDKKTIIPIFDTPYRGTHIRYQLQMEDWKTLRESVPEEIIKLYKQINAPQIIQSIERQNPTPPRIATDLIIVYNKKYIVGRRKHAPYGLALIWWMLDPWERIHECALREWYEELFQRDDPDKQLILTSQHPLRINDNPLRDPRWRIISFAYEAKILWWQVTWWDDISSITFLSPEEVMNRPLEDFAFPDHKDTLLAHITMNS